MRRVVVGIDMAAVVAFVAIGRSSHGHAETIGGFVSTAWPFGVGLGLGWLVALRAPATSLRGGLIVCGLTVATGMTLRVLVGQGTAAAFVVVALGFLGLFMVGGRLLLSGRMRRSGGRRLRSSSR